MSEEEIINIWQNRAAAELESRLATRVVVAPFPVPAVTLAGARRRRQEERRHTGHAPAGNTVVATPARVPARWSESGRVTAGAGRIAGVNRAGVKHESENAVVLA